MQPKIDYYTVSMGKVSILLITNLVIKRKYIEMFVKRTLYCKQYKTL